LRGIEGGLSPRCAELGWGTHGRVDLNCANSRSFAPLTPRAMDRTWGPRRADSQDDKTSATLRFGWQAGLGSLLSHPRPPREHGPVLGDPGMRSVDGTHFRSARENRLPGECDGEGLEAGAGGEVEGEDGGDCGILTPCLVHGDGGGGVRYLRWSQVAARRFDLEVWKK